MKAVTRAERLGYGPISWVVRILLFVCIGGLIGLCQIDRATTGRPGLINLVPEGLGGQADLVRSGGLVLSDPASADDATRSLLAHRPIPAAHLSLRALYLVEMGRASDASQALTLAAQRGWRDRYTQITVLGSALAAGNPEVAAQRLEALMRNRADWEIQAIAADQVLNDDKAREVFAARLGESPGLSKQLMEIAQRNNQLAPSIAITYLAASGQGEPIPCEEIGDISRRLLSIGEGGIASELWYDRCGKGGHSDLAFHYTSGQIGPFDWQFERGKGVASRPGSEDGTISTVNRSPVRRMIGYRYASLPEGRHSFRIQSRQASRALKQPAAEVVLGIKCGGRQSSRNLADLSPLDDQFEFDIPADCPQQVISVVSSRGRTTDLKLTKI